MHHNGGVTLAHRHRRRPRRLRDARGPVAASVATGAALLSHLVGGGAVPGWLGILVPWALSLVVCTALAGRSLSPWRTTVSVALSQLLFHTLFVVGAPASGAAGAAGSAGPTSAGRGMEHGVHGDPLPTPVGSSADLPDLIAADATMWFWHGVAAVITVAVLLSGEHTLLRLRELAEQAASRLSRLLPAPGDLAPPVAVVRLVTPDWFTGSFPARPEVSPSRRRGPPRAHAI